MVAPPGACSAPGARSRQRDDAAADELVDRGTTLARRRIESLGGLGHVRDSRSVPVRRQRGRPGTGREDVLRRAIDLFNNKGYDATAVGDLAEDFDITKSAIYHHVESKETLLAAALDDALGGLSAAVTTAAHAPREERVRPAARDGRGSRAHLGGPPPCRQVAPPSAWQ